MAHTKPDHQKDRYINPLLFYLTGHCYRGVINRLAMIEDLVLSLTNSLAMIEDLVLSPLTSAKLNFPI